MQELSKETIDNIFETATGQQECVKELYKVAIPDWEKVEKVNGFPKVGVVTHAYLFDKAIAFDKKHHPDVMAGGAMLNWGFSVDEDIKDWKVYVGNVTLIYKHEEE